MKINKVEKINSKLSQIITQEYTADLLVYKLKGMLMLKNKIHMKENTILGLFEIAV